MRFRPAVLVLGALSLAARTALAAAPPFAGVTTTTVASPDEPTVVPSEGSIVSLLFVDLDGEVADVDVMLDLAHPTASELDVYLVSPVGTTVALTTDNGNGFDDVFAGTLFDDQAEPPSEADPGTPAPHVRNQTYADFTVVGPVQPEGALGALFGDPAGGPWALVVVDDGGSTIGMLNGWSLTITTLPGVPPADTPAVFTASPDVELPNGDDVGVVVPITVSGLSGPLLDVDVTVDLAHPRATDVDLLLTSPSGRTIELATDVGGENDELWAGVTFDDDALEPVSDAVLPESGTAFSA